MNHAQKKRLEKDGWKFGDAQDFLGLSDTEAAMIDIKISLAQELKRRRAAHKVTQARLAKLVGSSQARVARMEAGDPSVSADLLIRTLLACGVTPARIATAIADPSATRPKYDFAKARPNLKRVAERRRP
jgi:DNA-binding XRE family transcriptional regulator